MPLFMFSKLAIMDKPFKYEEQFIEPIIGMHDKNNCLVIGPQSKVLEMMEKDKRFKYTKWDIILPKMCLGLGILVLFLILYVSSV